METNNNENDGVGPRKGIRNQPPKKKNLHSIKAPTEKQKANWKRTIDLLLEECSSQTAHPCLLHFSTSPLADIFRQDERVYTCFGRKNRSALSKELMEAAALEAQIKRIFFRDRCHPNSSDSKHNNVVVWDLCCGKGYSSVWLSKNTFPNAKIHLVDSDATINREYLPAFPNLTFHPLDLNSKKLETAIIHSKRETGEENNHTLLILVGIHLCGDLSRRALELHSKCGAHATFLSPCCAIKPTRKKGHSKMFGWDAKEKARKLRVVSPYQMWCWMLWGYAASCSPCRDQECNDERTVTTSSSSSSSNRNNRRRLDLHADTDMKTDKNIWITVVDSWHA